MVHFHWLGGCQGGEDPPSSCWSRIENISSWNWSLWLSLFGVIDHGGSGAGQLPLQALPTPRHMVFVNLYTINLTLK